MSEVSVLQADREAAADFYGPHLSRPGEVLVAAHMRAGKIDESPLVQAFAAHRLASTDDLVEALREISRLRPAGDVERCVGARKLVEQMERIALAALNRAGAL